jgi:hypothetical protein
MMADDGRAARGNERDFETWRSDLRERSPNPVELRELRGSPLEIVLQKMVCFSELMGRFESSGPSLLLNVRNTTTLGKSRRVSVESLDRLIEGERGT